MVLRKHVVLLWVANTALLVLILLASLVSDANSRLPDMDETSSIVMVTCLVSLGMAVDITLLLLDRRRWLPAVAIGAVYIVMLVPLLL